MTITHRPYLLRRCRTKSLVLYSAETTWSATNELHCPKSVHIH
ncbi:unnamed protein product [Amoebophrya sp. A25]|nr:unnamed protein product [Amoebophrya sp. A25]|eukprot:GSA25T00015581001.1